MKRQRLTSKVLSSYSYNPSTQTLHVWMRNGAHWIHSHVSQGMVEHFRTAEPPDFYYKMYIQSGPSRRAIGGYIAVAAILILALGGAAGYYFHWRGV